MPFANSDDAVLNYRLDGDEGLPVLVLSNGLGTDLAAWDRQIPALTREFRVLRYDTRGHGASSIPSRPISLEQLGRDVLGLLDRVGVARAHFCGLSMGGMIGMWLGIHAPERLDCLVLANTAARIGPVDMWNDRIGVVTGAGMKAITDAAMARWFTASFVAREPAAVAAVQASMERMSPEGYARCCAVVRDTDLRDDLARIATPVLVISGAHDVATPPADGDFIAQRVNGSRHVVIDAAHLSNIERPREFSEALSSFCRAARAPAAAIA